MTINWTLKNGAYTAETEFGLYHIGSQLSLYGREFPLTLSKGGHIHMEGKHTTVADAQRIAEEDMLYRQHMWETI